ncbi:Katanin p80 subunit, C-terminal, partial [Cinara cedri]
MNNIQNPPSGIGVDLMQEERFVNVSFKAIRDILQYFMPVIMNNIQNPPSGIGVDLMQEE